MGHILSFIVNRTLDEANQSIRFAVQPTRGVRPQVLVQLLMLQSGASAEEVDQAVEAIMELTATQRRIFIQELFQGQVFLKNTISTALGTFTSQAVEGSLGGFLGG